MEGLDVAGCVRCSVTSVSARKPKPIQAGELRESTSRALRRSYSARPLLLPTAS